MGVAAAGLVGYALADDNSHHSHNYYSGGGYYHSRGYNGYHGGYYAPCY